MNARPTVSAVITTTGRRSLLRRALISVLGQRAACAEVLLVDDGSPAGVEETLLDLPTESIRLIRNETSLGVSRARNQGISHCSGEWIAFLDDDDAWSPRKLERQLADAGSSAALLYTALVAYDQPRSHVHVLPAPSESHVHEELARNNVIGSPSSVVVRREIVLEAGGFDEGLSVLADWDLWLRLTRVHEAGGCSEPLTLYTIHQSNMHHSRGLRELLDEFDRLEARNGGAGSLDRAAYLRWLGWGYRHSGQRHRAARAFAAASLRSGRSRSLLTAVASLVRAPSYDAPSAPVPAWVTELSATAAPQISEA